MWPLLLLLFGVGGGCALNTSGMGEPDASEAVNDADDAVIPDIFDAVDEVSGDLPEFVVETADADSNDVYILDDGGDTDPCSGNLAPRSFHLLSPSPGENGISTRNILFDWVRAVPADPEGDPVTYTLTVGVDDDDDPTTPPAEPITEITGLTEDDVPYSLSLLPGDSLLFGARYQWSIKAIDNPCGNETEGISPRSFTTREYPICSKIGAEVRVTVASGNSLDPSLVWTESEYGLSWYDNRDLNYEIYFRRISAAGSLIGTELRVTNATGNSRGPSLVWNGSEYAVSWCDSREGGDDEIYFRKISSTGMLIDADIRVTNDPGGSKFPSLTWADGQYGVTWHDNRDMNREVYFRLLSASGAGLGTDVRVTSAINDSWNTSIAWDGTLYGVAWYDNREGDNDIYFRRITAEGVPLDSDIRLTSMGESRNPSLVWTGSEYVLVWHDNRDGNDEIYFGRISEGGMVIASGIRVTNDIGSSTNPALVWTGEGYGVIWQDNRGGDEDVYFKLISEIGNSVVDDVRITEAIGDSITPSIAWSGTEYAISWNDDRGGDSEIYFVRVGCEP